jgi:hypothetical protein
MLVDFLRHQILLHLLLLTYMILMENKFQVHQNQHQMYQQILLILLILLRLHLWHSF